jgi:flavin reductase (DIM6/NTAB) family NADH-FMN oxidoreductase RutF
MSDTPLSGPPAARPEAITPPHVATALGRIPSGLYVITWRADEVDRAMLASWVMQAGFEPPLVSVAIGTSRDLLEALRAGAPFVVNILGESQRPLLGRFGKPAVDGEDPFAGLALTRTAEGVAALTDAAAWLACRMVAEASVAEGDHVVILATIDAAHGAADAAPLIHLRKSGLRY